MRNHVEKMRVMLPLLLSVFVAMVSAQAEERVELKKGDHIAYIGNTLADRMQHDAWLETYLHHAHPDLELTVRNLGFSADEVTTRPRSANFGSPDQWLEKCEADVVFCFFGYNEALRGQDALAGFEANLSKLIKEMRSKKYNGESAPQLVVFSPIAHENLRSPHLPDGSENNQKLAAYTAGMKKVCDAEGVTFVNLFEPTQALYGDAEKPLTMNGIHLQENGNKAVAKVIMKDLFPGATIPGDGAVEKLREAVLEKNYYWFSRYRVVDGYNVYGGRSKLAWHGQSNADVMRREMEIFDVMTTNRDRVVWGTAQGGTPKVDDSNIPEELIVKTNKQGPLAEGAFPYLKGNDAIDKMTVHSNMKVNLFASEEQFPRLINPVQMSVDGDSRLWASVWESYPHWNPTEPRKDAIVILPDEDVDGVADELIVFADELNSVTGFEFWNGGILVAAPPEIWFLKDTDGDDKADLKVRMLQGVSSADTHHSANAMLVGPDGWLYWSRGVFNVANFETPTRTYRSGQTGVHRFNPRTFEMEFHFPIGPNPHGDVIDQWGYQFANDGTGGTGSYVNIGKGIGNKKWFEKRVRPVPATGILSSEHFPDEMNGNFLISNAIGFLGVLQHQVKYDGADITAEEIEPIVFSSDPNFRPSDLEIGGDGALYIADWHNALIGHMQHNMRDPNRDHSHGRVYRVTYEGRELEKPAKMRGKPIAEVCENFFSRTNNVRYRARLELSSRSAEEIIEQVGAFAKQLDPSKAAKNRNEAQALLECLWVFEEQRLPNMDLLKKVFAAKEPRVRAAAIRTLGHWNGRVSEWESLLLTAAKDESALVRAEAVKSAVNFSGATAADVIFEAATHPTDAELETVLKYAKSQIKVDDIIRDALANGGKLSPAAMTYALKTAKIDDLQKLPESTQLHRAVLARADANQSQLEKALTGLSKAESQSQVKLLMGIIEKAQAEESGNLTGLSSLLVKQSREELATVRERIETLATKGNTDDLKQVGYAAWVAAAGPDDAFLAATKSKQTLRDFLTAVTAVDPAVRGELYGKVAPLISELPNHLQAEQGGSSLAQPGIQVEYYYPSGTNVAVETLDAMTPKAVGIVPAIKMNVPQRKEADRFALRFTGLLQVPKSGTYTFFSASDDGSRLYVDDELVINHDGLHGFNEKAGKVKLSAGPHKLVTTYFDNGGGDGYRVMWSGPKLKKQEIAPEFLAVSGEETLHDVAIRALATIPGHDSEKFTALAELFKSGRSRASAVTALSTISKEHWPQKQIRPLTDNLIGYVSSMPARFRTGAPAQQAMALTKSLSTKLSDKQAKAIENRLQNLDVRVIAIGTVSHRMIYDKEMIAVQAGDPVEFRFSNTDAMPHNFAISMPGSLEEVGELAEKTGRDADAMDRHYIPKSDKILLASRLLQPGEDQALAFEAPKTPGVYPYVCTYPGHWRRMYGALFVVENLEEYQADPEAYLVANKLEIKDELLTYNSRSHEWTFEEVMADMKALPHDRSFEVGKQLFKVTSCVGCHKLDNEGQVFGPDLAKLDPKKHTLEHLVRSLVEPSKDIDDKYRSVTLALDSGKILTGMVVEETADTMSLVIDPLAKGKPTVVSKDSIDAQKKSDVSLMPKGLLNKLNREEIIDLLAFIYAGGKKDHMLFKGHHHAH